ncbi:hypothetical protein [Nonomuraea dietziae]|uniref:hypothetical protein n=1 Tax=Nonomuraea dietziae TaxID=65515 RepID=UPI0031D329B5
MIISTGTASGKSLAYLVPRHLRPRGGHRPLSHADQALAADQLRGLRELRINPGAGGHLRRRHALRGARLVAAAGHTTS